MYSKKTGKNGRTLFFKDNKLVSEKDIPDGAPILDKDMTLDETVRESANVVSNELETEFEEPVRKCIWGDGPQECSKFVNLQYIPLCQHHYDTATTGEVVQQLRESTLSHAESNE